MRGYEGFCGSLVCSTSGDWHIAWQLPLNGLMSDRPGNLAPFQFGLHGFAYFAASFLLPFIYGSWRFVVFHLVVGPLLADQLTVHPNEHAAVWCLLSIGLCVSVIKTRLRWLLRVDFWPGYELVSAAGRMCREHADGHSSRLSSDPHFGQRVRNHGTGRPDRRPQQSRQDRSGHG